MAQNYTWPPGFATAGTNASVGVNGAPIPGSSTLIAGKGPTGLETPVSVDSSGDINVIVAGSSGTLTVQDVADGSVTGGAPGTKSMLGGAIFNTSLPTLTTGQQAAIQLDSSARLILSPLTNSSIVKAQLQDNAGTAITLGQKVMASSLPVTLASDQSALAVSQSGTWSVRNQDGSGNSLTSTSNALDINLKTSSITLPVSLASVPLPTGAATSANQTSGAQKSQVVDGANAIVGPVQTVAGTNYLPVVLTASATPGSAIVARSVQVAGSDGTNAQTLSTDSSGKLKIDLNDGSGSAVNKGQTTSSGSLPVVLASDQSALTIKSTGNTPLTFVRNVYSTTNVTTAAYVQLVASTSGVTNVLEIFDSSGQTLKIAFGAAASEVDQFQIFPGGNGRVTCTIAAGTRISVRAVSATASSGELDINFYT